MSLTSSDGSTSPHTSPAAAPATNVDVHALWNQLSAMPVSERDNIAAGLSPTVRAQLRGTVEAIAARGRTPLTPVLGEPTSRSVLPRI